MYNKTFFLKFLERHSSHRNHRFNWPLQWQGAKKPFICACMARVGHGNAKRPKVGDSLYFFKSRGVQRDHGKTDMEIRMGTPFSLGKTT